MNNDYDRGEDGPRYTMSSFNKDLKNVVDTEIDISDLEPELVVGLFLLVDGTTVISHYTESIFDNCYTLDSPLTITVESSSMIDGEFSSSISYDHWMPLAKDRVFTIPNSSVITVTEPLDRLAEYYTGNNNG